MSSYNGNDRTQDEDENSYEHSNPFLRAFLDDNDVDNDRYLINFIKGVMTQENAVKSDMIKVLKEQILVLRQELLYKQTIIDSLLRHYEHPCIHGNNASNHGNNTYGNTVINPFNNAINMSHPMRFDEDTTKKPVITLYSTSSPIPSPFPSNIVNNCPNNCNHGSKIHNASIASCLSNDSLSSLVSKAVDKYPVSPASCTRDKTKDDNYNCVNGVNNSDLADDLTNWKQRESPLQTPNTINSKHNKDEDTSNTSKNESFKPLSETLLSLRNSIKSNIPRPDNSSSTRVQEPISTNANNASKDVKVTTKTFRVKFNKNGSQIKAKKFD